MIGRRFSQSKAYLKRFLGYDAQMGILTNPVFWEILEKSGSIDETRGMRRMDFKSQNASLTTFSKTHSYGEYIFDWAWAEAYERNGLPYYPKLTSMVPFTPATAPHFLGERSEWSKLLTNHDENLGEHSSAHFLFTTPHEEEVFREHNYLMRDSFQYHFMNEGYKSFEDFLLSLKTKKAKNIRVERSFPELKLERLTGTSLTLNHANEMYDFYLMTLEEKRAIPYLTRSFFQMLFQEMPENVLYVKASNELGNLAGALFYYDEEKLYGRYWGANSFIHHLHFELCYYQGIEFCIEKGLKVFEAGAQGEHKIARGFRPILTRSAHKIHHPGFSEAIKLYIEEEKKQVAEAVRELTQYLPFKR